MIPESKVTDEMWAEYLKRFPPKEKPDRAPHFWLAICCIPFVAFASFMLTEINLMEDRLKVIVQEIMIIEERQSYLQEYLIELEKVEQRREAK